MAAQFQNFHQRLVENSVLAPNNECLLWTGPKRGHYGSFNYLDKGENKWRQKTAHRMSYIVYVALDMQLTSELDCSHLCHNTLCVNSKHICLEPRYVNNYRKTCKSSNVCSGHGDYPNCLLDLVMA